MQKLRNLPVRTQLLFAYLLHFSTWFGWTYMLDWLNERKPVPLKERVLYALFLGTIMFCLNHWKQIKTLRSKNV